MSCLVADIGGTNLRLAIGNPLDAHLRVLHEGPHSFDPISIMTNHARSLSSSTIEGLALGIAGPVHPDEPAIPIVNTPMVLQLDVIARAIRCRYALAVNDALAHAMGVAELQQSSLKVLDEVSPTLPGTRLVLVIGTSLGIAMLGYAGRGAWLPMASEGGHAGTALTNSGPTNIELVSAGRGIPRAFFDSGGSLELDLSRAGAEVCRRAARGDAIALRAIDLYLHRLGRVSVDLAQITGATGGIFFTGAVINQLNKAFGLASLVRAFRADHPRADYLRAIPLVLVTDDSVALRGLVGFSRIAQSGSWNKAHGVALDS